MICKKRSKEGQQTVELRYKFTEIFGMLLVFGGIGAVAMLKPDILPADQGFFSLIPRILGFLCLLCGIGVSISLASYMVIVNEHSIKWSNCRQNHQIEWEQIKGVYVCQNGNQENGLNYTNLLLFGFMDEELGNIKLPLSYPKEKQRLVTFIAERVNVTYEFNPLKR